MWYFERVRYSLDRHLLDEDVLFRTVGFHSWWWGQLLIHIRAPKASVALHELACRTEGWAVTNSEIGNWVARCSTDFDGHGPVVLWAPPQPFAPPVG
jgi:hypothetical protein